MPAIALSLLAGSLSAATPLTPQPWFTFADYPMKAFEKSEEGVTRFELLIAPDGRVAKCTIIGSSGHEELDKTSCYLASRRAKFRPAYGADGEPLFGTYRSQTVWALPEHKIESNPGPDLVVSLNELPAGTNQPPVVKLAYSVDVEGKPTGCAVMPWSVRQPKLLVDLACKELIRQIRPAPVLAPSGQPVAAVKSGAVKFDTDKFDAGG